MTQKRNARMNNVDRPVKDGDTVILDYKGSVDGEEFEGGSAEEYPLVIGSDSFIPGFEDQLVGAEKKRKQR
jgi:trigger factor